MSLSVIVTDVADVGDVTSVPTIATGWCVCSQCQSSEKHLLIWQAKGPVFGNVIIRFCMKILTPSQQSEKRIRCVKTFHLKFEIFLMYSGLKFLSFLKFNDQMKRLDCIHFLFPTWCFVTPEKGWKRWPVDFLRISFNMNTILKDSPFASMEVNPTDHISSAAVMQCWLVSSSTDHESVL